MNISYDLVKTILQPENNLPPKESALDKFTSIQLYGDSTEKERSRDEIGRRFHLANSSGTGDLTLYRVFPGIELVYNDIHMAYCNKHQQPAPHVVEINYCKEGRSECLFEKHQYCYMSAGDLSFCSLHDHGHRSEFPTSHYHGITVTLDFSAITEEMKEVLQWLSIDLAQIKALSQARSFTIIRANATIEHIFSELYKVPPSIRQGYIRIKVLELLLVLTELDPAKTISTTPYFPASQIDTVKEIHRFLMEHFNEHYTISMLSEQFHISPTIMKKCFRGVYGDSIYAYMKQYRLQMAKQLLESDDLTIAEIASQIGYLNPNKFTSAFRTAYGIPPTTYRKKVQMDRKESIR